MLQQSRNTTQSISSDPSEQVQPSVAYSPQEPPQPLSAAEVIERIEQSPTTLQEKRHMTEKELMTPHTYNDSAALINYLNRLVKLDNALVDALEASHKVDNRIATLTSTSSGKPRAKASVNAQTGGFCTFHLLDDTPQRRHQLRRLVDELVKPGLIAQEEAAGWRLFLGCQTKGQEATLLDNSLHFAGSNGQMAFLFLALTGRTEYSLAQQKASATETPLGAGTYRFQPLIAAADGGPKDPLWALVEAAIRKPDGKAFLSRSLSNYSSHCSFKIDTTLPLLYAFRHADLLPPPLQ